MTRPTLALLLPALTVAARLTAQQPPATPIVQLGACPFECCQLGAWVARDSLPVFTAERSSGTPAFVLLPGRRFLADSANFYTLALGVVVARRAFRLADYVEPETTGPSPGDSARRAVLAEPLAPGDTLYFIGEVSEVGEAVWWHGVTATVTGLWSEPSFTRPTAPAVLVRPITQEWWVHVDAGGRRGWIQAWGPAIDGADACG